MKKIRYALLLFFIPLLLTTCKDEDDPCIMEVKIAASSINQVMLLETQVTGGLAPFKYQWSPGNSTDSAITVNVHTAVEVYSVTVTDALGCTATASFDNKCKGLNVTIDTKDLGGGITELTAVGHSGNLPYQLYKWSTGEVQEVITVGPGTYTVTITDALQCTSDTSITVDSVRLVGSSGNPRFNLQFTNHEVVDLDLYVKTPNNNVISYDNETADGGTLDVDCYCVSCPNGPSENIYWVPGTAPKGTYTFWVEYYRSCDGSNVSSTYTIRRMNEFGVAEETHVGTIGAGQEPTEYTFTIL